MAVLTPTELAELRRGVSKDEHPDWNKSQINAALQAIEDLLESTRPSASGVVNAATAPYIFSDVVKQKLYAHSMRQKFSRENV